MSLMAFLPVSLILSIIALISTNAKSQTNHPNTITLGSFLSPNANTTPIWLSPSGIFAFGFYSQNDGFAVGVLMLNRSEATITWTANRDDPPLSSNATLELTHNGELLVRTDQEQGRDKVQLIAKTSSLASSASMLDSGNFVLYDNNSHVIWQSFDSPTDTILGGQNLTSGRNLISSKSASDLSSGRFLLGMQEDGNLVMYPVNSTYSPGDAYWASGSSGAASKLCLNRTGFLYLQGRILANGSSGEKENEINNVIIHRATLDADGIFRLYSHYFWSNKSSRVVTKWSALENRCQVKGFCGFNSFCALEGQESASCHCFPGFDFVDPRSNTLGCYQNFGEDNCRENGASGLIMRYNITGPLQNMWWINNPYSVLPLKKELCSKSCLDDCNCWVVSFTSANDCRKYKLPLKYGTKNENVTATAFFKVVLGNTDTPTHVPPGIYDPEVLVRSKNAPIFILALSLGSDAVLCFVFAVSSFVVYRNRAHKYKKLCDSNVALAEDYFTLQSFSYDELEKATNGFKEELGRGCFGAVYKGTLVSMNNKAIAVKRLEKVVEEGIREFRAEMTTIGRTHHRNLVQLIGFCIEGSKKLLVYEFMSNGSLADLLFKAVLRPRWRERVRFILDVAKGVFYLHEECGVHVIHCNLKPQNILLDDAWTAKISDFGLARLLRPSQGKMSTDVDGTSIGYFAPEWQKNALISVKADIYSFGIVLLETLCCRRNIDVNVSTPDEIILSSWVYRCFVAGELNKLLEDSDFDEEVDMIKLERMVKVGLWCVQDDPALRPSMKNVILMLEGTMDIPIPPCPELPLTSC